MYFDFNVVIPNFFKGVSLVTFSPVGLFALIVLIARIAKRKFDL